MSETVTPSPGKVYEKYRRFVRLTSKTVISIFSSLLHSLFAHCDLIASIISNAVLKPGILVAPMLHHYRCSVNDRREKRYGHRQGFWFPSLGRLLRAGNVSCLDWNFIYNIVVSDLPGHSAIFHRTDNLPRSPKVRVIKHAFAITARSRAVVYCPSASYPSDTTSEFCA